MKRAIFTPQEFFVVALPGLEDLVEAEIHEFHPDWKLSREHGGVTLRAPLEDGLALNLVLKTATRVLVRVFEKRLRDFPSLFKTVSAMDWKQWIDPSSTLTVHASTRVSRLKIKKRIEETCHEAWSAYQRKLGVKADPKRNADLYVRFANDICTLSLDTSGERLHKRGEREYIGEAPLRESIAAALIQWVGREFSGDVREAEVIDPMMGSGTFLLEAALRDEPADRRAFAFENFARAPESAPALQADRVRIASALGYEIDAKTLQAARHNLEPALAKCEIKIINADIFKAEPLPRSERARWLFCNPPYGERLKIEQPLADYYRDLFAACARVANPQRACFIIPTKAVKGKFQLPPGWKVLAKRPFLNGGIPVTAFIFGTVSV